MIQRGEPIPHDTDKESAAPDGRPLALQPKWRRDFPIDWARDEFVSRRDLVKFIVLTSGAFAVGQLWIVAQRILGSSPGTPKAPPQLPVATVDELPVGGAKTFHYPQGSTPRLLVRTGPQSFVAYDQQCTHLLCPVVPAVQEGKLHCPCHNGWFDLQTGNPIAGPPQRPLPKVSLKVLDGRVWATGIEEPST